MSKRVIVSVNCNNCKGEFKTELYRTLWIEFPENRELILTDKINVIQCPQCNFTFRAEYSFLAVDINKHFAVWFEPIHDDAIDTDVLGYSILLGENNFYSKAPRILNWEYFKQVISKYDIGYFQANPIDEKTVRDAMYKLGDELKTRKSKNNV